MNTKHISTLFSDVTKRASEVIRERNRVWIPEFARCKAQFLLRTGSSSIPYHSYDITNIKGQNVTNEEIGFYKLLEMIAKRRENDEYVTASIWCKLGDDLRTYSNGVLSKDYDFFLFKHVRHENPWLCPYIKFNNGKLDTSLIKKVMQSGDEKLFPPRKEKVR